MAFISTKTKKKVLDNVMNEKYCKKSPETTNLMNKKKFSFWIEKK